MSFFGQIRKVFYPLCFVKLLTKEKIVINTSICLKKQEFALEVYKQIRAEVSVLVERIASLFRYTMLVSATVFAWTITNAFSTATMTTPSYGILPFASSCLTLPRAVFELLWWIPPGFVFISGLIALMTQIRVWQMGEFLRRCEISLGERMLSWEVFLQSKHSIFTLGSVIAWVVMLGVTLYAANIGVHLKDLPICFK